MKYKSLYLMLLWGMVWLMSAQFVWAQSAANQYVIWENDLQSETLADNQLETFMERGKQKIYDFFDILGLLKTETEDEVWRQTLIEQGIDLFMSDSVRCFDQTSVSAFIRANADDTLEIVAVELIQPFLQQEESYQGKKKKRSKKKNEKAHKQIHSYTGKYSVRFNHFNEQDSQKAMIDLHLEKKSKAFGKQELWLWEVKLGNIILL